jgi:pyrroline-5-carboxylate reductase
MTEATICFIGAGNMARAMIGGLTASGYPTARISACDVNVEQCDAIAAEFDITTSSDCNALVESADIVILAVKPQVMQAVCSGLTSTAHRPLFISIAAGLRVDDIDRWLGGGFALVRCMPNTPALLGQGASGLFANAEVDDTQRQQAQRIMQSIGISCWVKNETDLDAVTAISGSGPAYFFLFIEALQQAAEQLGLDPDTAFELSRQTALGAASMALNEDVVKLRRQVTSPGGTTERAIESFSGDDLNTIVLRAAQAAQQRAQELGDELARAR